MHDILSETERNFGGGYAIIIPLIYIVPHSILYWFDNAFVVSITNNYLMHIGLFAENIPLFSHRIEEMEGAGMHSILPFMKHLYGCVIVSSFLLALINILLNPKAFHARIDDLQGVSVLKKNTLTIFSLTVLTYLLIGRDDIPVMNSIGDLFFSGHLNFIASVVEFFLLYTFLSVVIISVLIYGNYMTFYNSK